jgi:hypothetical protein
MLWQCLLASLLVVAGYALCALYSGNLKVAFLGGLTTWLFGTIGSSVRPQMLGYLFLAGLLLAIELGRRRGSGWFFALPPLFAVWVNCHGSFALGLIVAWLTLACTFVELEWGLLASRRWTSGRRTAFGIAFGLSIAALFLNPVGFRQITYSWDVMFAQHIGTAQVSEWQPPHFDETRGIALLAAGCLILLIPLLRRVQLTVQELLVVALGFGLAIQHERMLAVFGILAAPVLCRLLADAWDQYDPDRDRMLPNAVLMALSLGVMVLFFPSRQQLSRLVEQDTPVKAVNFINLNGAQLPGNMLNEYVYGGYLIWAAPSHKVFIDGRSDVFEWTGVLEEYGKWATLQADPQVLLDKYRIGFCLLSVDSPLTRVLPLLPEWKKVYSDEMSVIWARSPAGA